MRTHENAPADVARGAYHNESANSNPNYNTALLFRGKKLPPYAKRLCFSRQLYIQVGWPDSPPGDNGVVLPRDEHPASFKWRFVKGRHIFVSSSDLRPIPEAVAIALSREIIAEGVEAIFIFGTAVSETGLLCGLHWWPDDMRGLL